MFFSARADRPALYSTFPVLSVRVRLQDQFGGIFLKVIDFVSYFKSIFVRYIFAEIVINKSNALYPSAH